MKKFGLLLIYIFTISCSIILPYKKEGFSIYKTELSHDMKYNLNLNGYYTDYINNDVSFILYRNGLVYWIPNFGTLDTNIMNRYLANSHRREYWGHYSIMDDSISIQVFNENKMEFFKRWVFEFNGEILSDTSFVIFNKMSVIRNIASYDTVKFYLCKNIKPDSNNIWFLNKKWYKNEIHESRSK